MGRQGRASDGEAAVMGAVDKVQLLEAHEDIGVPAHQVAEARPAEHRLLPGHAGRQWCPSAPGAVRLFPVCLHMRLHQVDACIYMCKCDCAVIGGAWCAGRAAWHGPAGWGREQREGAGACLDG